MVLSSYKFAGILCGTAAEFQLFRFDTGVATAAFFCFMFSWVEFLLSNALTTIDVKPFGGIMTREGSLMSGHIPLIAAAGVLGVVPGTIIAIALRRHLAQGFSLGRTN